MKASRLILAALVCTTPLLAAAQWVYLDQAGRKVFSDQAPPPSVAPNRILRQPGVKPGTSVAVAAESAEGAAAQAPAASASGAAKTGTDKNLEARKKQADEAAANKKRADEEKVAQLRVESCGRARAAKADFESGVRIVRTNDKGEREVMDDKQREAEVRRIDSVIASDCKR